MDIRNNSGAIIYGDISKHEMLEIPALKSTNETGKVYHVLAVGVHKSGTAMVTVKENGQAKAYILPDGNLQVWVKNSIAMAWQGMDAYPADVEFGKLPTGHYAEIL